MIGSHPLWNSAHRPHRFPNLAEMKNNGQLITYNSAL
jgi:hypothetical protein